MKPTLFFTEFTVVRKRWMIIGALLLSTLSLLVKADTVSVLNTMTMIKTGSTQVMLPSGTVLSILKKSDLLCVVSITLPDGTPIITQFPPNLISTQEVVGKRGHAPLKQLKLETSVNTFPEPIAPATDSQKTKQTDSSSEETPSYPVFKLPLNLPDSLLPPLRYTVQTGTFQLPINNTVASVVYAVPMEGHKLAESASNLIFYGPYPNEKTKLSDNILPDFVRKLGCTVFSFQIDGLGLSVSDKPYWFKEAGWFDAALRSRDILIKRFTLQPKKLILVGYSGGGGMVMNFAGAFPDQIEAVAAHAPNVVPSFPDGNEIKWLMVVNRGDTNRAVMKPFYNQLHSENCQALFCETTPDRNRGHYHAPSGQTFDLIYSFIAGILDQRRLTDKDITDVAHLWPYVSPSEPIQRYAIVKTSDVEPDDLQRGHFDLLPSLAFTMQWSRVCPPAQVVKAGSGHTRLALNFPARPVPDGIVFYYDNPSYEDIPREVEDINSLAENGYLVISTMTANPEDFVDAASAWVKSQDTLRGLHLHLIGNGALGARFISSVAKRNDISFRSLSVIDFSDTWRQTDYIEDVISAAKECGMFGFYSYSNSNSETDLENWAGNLVDKGAQDRGCFNLCSKPVETFKTSESVRHTQAEIQALTMIESLIAKADAR